MAAPADHPADRHHPGRHRDRASTASAGTGPLLILSQVILSLQLPFAVFPLVMFTSDRARWASSPSPPWVKLLAWSVAVVIAALNVWLLYQTVRWCRSGWTRQITRQQAARRAFLRFALSSTMYKRILVAVENSQADRTILDHVQRSSRRLTGRGAAARARRRRLGGAELRPARSCANPRR